MIGSNNHAKRMVKVHVARAPQDNYTPNSASATVEEASGPTHSSVSSSLSTSTTTLAGVISFLGVALILVLGIYLYRRHKNQSAWKRRAPAVEFDPNAFTVEKKSMQQQRMASPMIPARSPTYQASITSKDSDDSSSSSSSSSTSESGAGWKPQGSPATTTTSPKFRVTNENRGSAPALPKLFADKKRPSRGKAWTDSLTLALDDALVRSPPPSYDLANSAGPEFLVPVPTMMPVEKGRRVTPTPPTPPAHTGRKSMMAAVARASSSSSKPSTPVTPKSSASSMYVQTLMVPVTKNEDGPPSVSSPARSESFAPKDLIMPPPPTSATSSKTKHSPPASANPFASSEDSYYSGNSSSSNYNNNNENNNSNSISIKHDKPRMMHVIAHYNPTLSDELRVHVGDTVKVLEEYKDGWCFAQYVGKADAPKGVVPLICLEERLRMVPVAHSRSPNGSLSSLSNWRH